MKATKHNIVWWCFQCMQMTDVRQLCRRLHPVWFYSYGILQKVKRRRPTHNWLLGFGLGVGYGDQGRPEGRPCRTGLRSLRKRRHSWNLRSAGCRPRSWGSVGPLLSGAWGRGRKPRDPHLCGDGIAPPLCCLWDGSIKLVLGKGKSQRSEPTSTAWGDFDSNSRDAGRSKSFLSTSCLLISLELITFGNKPQGANWQEVVLAEF